MKKRSKANCGRPEGDRPGAWISDAQQPAQWIRGSCQEEWSGSSYPYAHEKQAAAPPTEPRDEVVDDLCDLGATRDENTTKISGTKRKELTCALSVTSMTK